MKYTAIYFSLVFIVISTIVHNQCTSVPLQRQWNETLPGLLHIPSMAPNEKCHFTLQCKHNYAVNIVKYASDNKFDPITIQGRSLYVKPNAYVITTLSKIAIWKFSYYYASQPIDITWTCVKNKGNRYQKTTNASIV